MIDISISDDLSDEAQEAIYEELRLYNLEQNGAFFDARERPEHAPRALYAVARDGEGRVVGGLTAETQFAWLRVSIMAVVASERGRGTGRQLMAAAEREAVARGCRYAYVDTMDYQAPRFYEKLGYRVAGKLDDWDSHGHAKYFLMKQLVAPGEIQGVADAPHPA